MFSLGLFFGAPKTARVALNSSVGGRLHPALEDSHVDRVKYYSSCADESARLALLDSMGCAIETLVESIDGRTLIGPVEPGTTVPHGFHLPGTKFVLDLVKGASDLGTLIRNLRHTYDSPSAEWGHATDSLGVIIAFADWLSRRYAADNNIGRPVTLEAVLRAQIRACEIQGALQADNNLNKRGLDNAILAKIASAAPIARLMWLNEEDALGLLNYAWQEEHPLKPVSQTLDSIPMKGWVAGNTCSRAVHLYFLAMTSQPGAPSVLTLIGSKLFVGLVAKVAIQIAERLEVTERAVGDIKNTTITTRNIAKGIEDERGPRGITLTEANSTMHKAIIRKGGSKVEVEMKDEAEFIELDVGFSVCHPKQPETMDFVQKKFRANMIKGGFESTSVR
ncbi:MmgE/PrpD family-domain-containing protein [Hypoxylon sp. FL1150]|nr:MmgE/PrpD family-domain-containing protein [Hypoxylon sp. FL1150]